MESCKHSTREFWPILTVSPQQQKVWPAIFLYFSKSDLICSDTPCLSAGRRPGSNYNEASFPPPGFHQGISGTAGVRKKLREDPLPSFAWWSHWLFSSLRQIWGSYPFLLFACFCFCLKKLSLLSKKGGLVFPSLEQFSTACCDLHCQRLSIVNEAEVDVFLEFSCFS